MLDITGNSTAYVCVLDKSNALTALDMANALAEYIDVTGAMAPARLMVGFGDIWANFELRPSFSVYEFELREIDWWFWHLAVVPESDDCKGAAKAHHVYGALVAAGYRPGTDFVMVK